MATPIRFELTIFAVTGRHVNRYTTGPFLRYLLIICVLRISVNMDLGFFPILFMKVTLPEGWEEKDQNGKDFKPS